MSADTPDQGPASRSDQIRRLAERAIEVGEMLVGAHVITGDEQIEFLLDCSSMADKFARDLDLFVGAPR